MAQRKQTKAGKLANRRINKREAAVLERAGVRVAKAEWEFAVDGGDADAIIGLGLVIPEGAIVTRVITEELEAVSDSGADAVDCDILVGSTEVASAIDFDGDAGIQSRTVTLSKAAADSELGIRFNTDAADAGKVRVFVEYMVSE